MAKEVTIKVQGRLGGNMNALEANLDRLLRDRSVLGRLVRRAMAETLLKAYRDRFLKALPQVIDMERSTTDAPGRKIPPELEERLREAAERLTSAQIDGSAKEIASAREALNQASHAVAQSLKRRTGGSKLATGQFRRTALQVMNLVADAGLIHDVSRRGKTSFAAGSFKRLNEIKTPSASAMLRGRPTKSRFNIMWKHIEFGTGVYADDVSWNATSRSKLQGGSGEWWYGKGHGLALLLRGSRPAHAMFKNAEGLAYEGDAPKFAKLFGTLLAVELRQSVMKK
jgi:hypothetical protein